MPANPQLGDTDSNSGLSVPQFRPSQGGGGWVYALKAKLDASITRSLVVMCAAPISREITQGTCDPLGNAIFAAPGHPQAQQLCGCPTIKSGWLGRRRTCHHSLTGRHVLPRRLPRKHSGGLRSARNAICAPPGHTRCQKQRGCSAELKAAA